MNRFTASLIQIGATGALWLAALPAAGQSNFWPWAERPVMGWNSWDFYGTSINEACAKAQANYLASNLLAHGWNLVTVDIQWYQPTATGFTYLSGATLSMDSYGRLTPATNRFPSAIGGAGFKPLADYVHALGLKFGIHMMRGIPRQAVTQNTPVFGTTNTASQIVDVSSTCAWNSDMYGVDPTQPGGQAYYDSLLALVASWGVDFVKIDDFSRPYHLQEIEAIRAAINKCGRAMVLSTSPGATPLGLGAHVMQHANQWRISDDFWDNWTALYEQFQRLHDWTPYRGPGHFPDGDMLPLGKVSGGNTNATGRSTYFTTNEQYTLMSLWAIARSPLILGADMTQMDPFTLSLLTNDAVMAVNQYSCHNRQLFRTNDLIAWTADAANSTNKYLALFNATSNTAPIPVDLTSLGYTNACAIRSLWDGVDLGSFTGAFVTALPAHCGALYRLAGPALPVPWITNSAIGSNRVTLSWEGIDGVTSYSVKRAPTETGTYQTVSAGITNVTYTDTTALNGETCYYEVSATIGGQETPNSGMWAATPVGAAGVVSWNYDRYGTLNTNGLAGAVPVTNWNNSYPNDPVASLLDNHGAPTPVAIVYNSYGTWSIQDSHPGADANGTYDKELLNGYLNSGADGIPTTSSIVITQIPFSYYDLYVYFSSDTAGRAGTITDGTTTYNFTTLGAASIASSNATLTQTTDTAGNYPAANCARFSDISGSNQTVVCNIPLYGGIAGFQIVPLADPLPETALATQWSAGDNFIGLSWPAAVGTVRLQQSDDLLTWYPAEAQPASNTINLATTNARQFFRLTRP
jgi:hypothetical protein